MMLNAIYVFPVFLSPLKSTKFPLVSGFSKSNLICPEISCSLFIALVAGALGILFERSTSIVLPALSELIVLNSSHESFILKRSSCVNDGLPRFSVYRESSRAVALFSNREITTAF